MNIGIVGLGRMGGNMARRLARGGVRVVGHDADAGIVQAMASERVVTPAASLAALAAALQAPRIVWLMVPAGAVTEATIDGLLPHLMPGDVVVDGGNANYKDSQRRAAALDARGIGFVDCGVSGGVWGLEHGYALMFGGADTAARQVEPMRRRPTPAGFIAVRRAAVISSR
jgi:6-phosphogluconate dehydrogenase